MKKPTESDLVRAVLQYLHAAGYWAERYNAGGHTVRRSGRRSQFVRSGPTGMSDVLVLLSDGPAVFLECKMPGKKPTVAQRAFGATVERRGHVYLVVTSLDELIESLKRLEDDDA